MSKTPSPITDPALDQTMDLDPSVDVESWRMDVPAKPACYLLQDETGRPVLLATVADLRGALVRRLTEPDAEGPTRRIEYRQVVRRVRYRQVGGPFEANWAYLENARRFYPSQYKKMIGRFTCRWLCLDLAGEAPKFSIENQPQSPIEGCFGPMGHAREARRVLQGLEDLFDLCREHALLQQAPHATACPYKEMGRCPAPCDGSITMASYRVQLQAAQSFLMDPPAYLASQQDAMKAAAEALQFEAAAACKRRHQRAETLEPLPKPLLRFDHVGIHPGSTGTRRTLFRVCGGAIERVGEFKVGPALIEAAVGLKDQSVPAMAIDDQAAERMALAAHDMRRVGAEGRWWDAAGAWEDVNAFGEAIDQATAKVTPADQNVVNISSED